MLVHDYVYVIVLFILIILCAFNSVPHGSAGNRAHNVVIKLTCLLLDLCISDEIYVYVILVFQTK